MKKHLAVALIPLLLAPFTATSATAAPADDSINLQVPMPSDAKEFIPCGNGGQGEWVQLSGTLHVRIQTNIDASGGIHAMTSVQPQGVVGVGLVTGNTYHATGGSRESTTIGKDGESALTMVNNYRLIGQGHAVSFVSHENSHVGSTATEISPLAIFSACRFVGAA